MFSDSRPNGISDCFSGIGLVDHNDPWCLLSERSGSENGERDVGATLATFKPGSARLELPGEELVDGPDSVADTYRDLFTGFPDLSFPDLRPGSLCHHGDTVIAESRLQGTHLGPFRGLPPTGRRMDVPLVAIFEFDGPDLLCERACFDRLTMFIQLGVARDLTLVRAALRARRLARR